MRAAYIEKSLGEAVGEEEGAGTRKVVVVVEGLKWSFRGEAEAVSVSTLRRGLVEIDVEEGILGSGLGSLCLLL